MTMNYLLKTLRTAWLCLVMVLAITPHAWAHDPFDGNIQAFVLNNKIEVKVTIGYDAARAFFRSSGLPPREAARMTRPNHRGQPVGLPAALAARLVTMRAGGQAVLPSAFLVQPSDIEVSMIAVFPRPQGQTVQLRAAYFDLIDDMRPGSLVVADQDRKLISTALVSKKNPSVTVPLTLTAANVSADGAARFKAFFKLGVEHILTGFDHLLFLCALLLSLGRIRTMFGIITAFTVSHSITLALSALDIVKLSPAIVEPVIAASIIAACLGNLLRHNAPQDRYWMAGGFGLLHGFGFAGALRETVAATSVPGSSLALPIFSFNLGVEAGQLLVAAVIIPLLLLSRRQPAFARHGTSVLSAAIIVVSGYWLGQRLGLA